MLQVTILDDYKGKLSFKNIILSGLVYRVNLSQQAFKFWSGGELIDKGPHSACSFINQDKSFFTFDK